MELLSVRSIKQSDIQAVCEIYAYYVENTAITFECKAPSVEEFSERVRDITKKYPFLVAEHQGKVVGYCYASAFHKREAYKWSAEASLYVKKDFRRMGIGKVLYCELEARLSEMGITNLNACIAYTECEDEHLDNSSMLFHQKMGYTLCARFNKCAYKFEKWYSMIWMEKILLPHEDFPQSPKFGIY